MAKPRTSYPDLSKAPTAPEGGYPDLSVSPSGKNQSFWSKLPRNITAGLAQMGHGLINTPHNVANMINPEFAKHIPKQEEYDYPELLGLPKEATMTDKLIRGVAQFAPAMALPVAEMGIGGEAAGLLSRMGAQAVPQAAFGATQNPNPLHGAAEGAVAGAIGEAGGAAIANAYHGLKPSTRLRGNLSKEALKRNLESAEGTTTPLGRILESPSLNRTYENVLPHVMGSGAESTMQKTTAQVASKAEDLLEKVRDGENPGDTSIALQDALKKASAAARKEKNASYEKLNEAANQAGLTVGRDEFQNTANTILHEIEQSPELKEEFSKDLYKDLQRYASNPKGNNLKLTNIFRGKLGDKANELYQTGKMHEYGIVNSLKEALSKDIDDTFQQSGNQGLKNLYDQTQKEYAENFAPFEDKDIVKFTRKGGDPDLILPHFLRGGKNDRANILTKLTSLPQATDKNISTLLSYAHLSKAVNKNGEIDPLKLSALYRNLGEKQKKALIPDKNLRSEFEKYTNLVGMNKEAFDLMRNPKTGARNTDLLIKVAQMFAGNAAGGLPGIVATAAGGAALGRGATKALSSEKLRTNLIKKMIEGKKTKIPGKKAIPGLLQMELNNYAGEQ